ncbi:alkaline phosphatase [Acinetobacter qingfengensis]|uniref:Alkaline phosphatase n=1 Tax=Acinetobacter qingfengensis TaxID=1262585 RepID=A0A1E7RFK6_9GAMM|nr:alkaline phosphatase [Acinetobacter qingfengensis]KAA8732806.1 alkaline phosphatase [Acinetobacter qingfengensis]OEY98083.1 alkaline phosphatase [Acinetobacter qingfengensis]
MQHKMLMLPILMAMVVGCTTSANQQSSKPTVSTATSMNAALIDASAKGDLTVLGGATRLKQERSELLKSSINSAKAKNVILFIGDGTSDSEITIARNYIEGASGYLKGIDVLPFTGSYTTYSIDKSGTINYVTDSAASATAWATGTKAYNGAIGVNLKGQAQASLLEIAKKAGLATGNVTTTEIQDATPAAMYAHVTYRKCYGPSATTKSCPTNALENGGLGSITEQLIRSHADVTLGGGAATFNEVATAGAFKGQTLFAQAQAKGFNIVKNASELQAVTKANQQKPVLGLFAEGNLPVIWTGPASVVGGNKLAPVSCQNNAAFTAQTPLLKDMTAKAIELLKDNPKGFFLQVESGSIDKENHAGNICGQIGETKQLDEAMQVALQFAKQHGDTLIIVTGDHAHTSQIIPIGANSPGRTVSLLTAKDHAPMAINYATETGSSQTHTGVQVRIAAFGPRAANVNGLLDQTDLFFVIRDALGLQSK